MVSRLDIHKQKKKKSFPFQILLFSVFFLTTSSVVYVGYQVLNKDNNDIIEETVDGKLPTSQLKISINAFPTFEDGQSNGTLSIKNDISNRYNMIVEIYLEETGKLVYKSSLLAPGKIIKSGRLKEDLDEGRYSAIAYFNAYTKDSNEFVGKSAAKITLVIKK